LFPVRVVCYGNLLSGEVLLMDAIFSILFGQRQRSGHTKLFFQTTRLSKIMTPWRVP
jgi:hypothetical protein